MLVLSLTFIFGYNSSNIVQISQYLTGVTVI